MSPRSLLVLLSLACALALPAGAQAATLAQPGGPTTVREHDGILVFSQFDATTGQYRLAIRRPGAAAPELLPVAPSDRAFDADIGLGQNGGSQLVYVRCDETCDLFTYDLGGTATPAGERRIQSASDPDHHDVHPTVWRGRLAWARIYGEQRDRKVVVYTRRFTGPSPRRVERSTRLPGIPATRLARSTTGHAIDALELWGQNLGQVVSYECGGCPGIRTVELRLVRTGVRSSRVVATQPQGLGGQTYAGPSFAGGWISWYRTCLGDPEGCRGGGAGPYRQNLQSRALARGTGGPIRVHGFVDTIARHVRVEGCSEAAAEGGDAGCRLEEADPPPYLPG